MTTAAAAPGHPLDDPLTDFAARTVSLRDRPRRVYVSGAGPAVLVLPEMPGISPDVARFARWVRGAGFTVYLPSLFGRDGAWPLAQEGARVVRRACVAAEFRALGGGVTSPITGWLRELAALAYDECGPPGVGVVGMCFTGNFALTMMLEPSVLAAVLAQPSLPLDEPAALEISPEDLRAVADRLRREDIPVLGWRFAGDPFCRSERFAAYAEALGGHFVARELPDDCAKPDPPEFFAEHVPHPHSVLTAHLVDEDGHPTLRARDDVLAYLTDRLRPPATKEHG